MWYLPILDTHLNEKDSKGIVDILVHHTYGPAAAKNVYTVGLFSFYNSVAFWKYLKGPILSV